jgi:hypothetical protein
MGQIQKHKLSKSNLSRRKNKVVFRQRITKFFHDYYANKLQYPVFNMAVKIALGAMLFVWCTCSSDDFYKSLRMYLITGMFVPVVFLFTFLGEIFVDIWKILTKNKRGRC